MHIRIPLMRNVSSHALSEATLVFVLPIIAQIGIDVLTKLFKRTETTEGDIYHAQTKRLLQPQTNCKRKRGYYTKDATEQEVHVWFL